MIFAKTWWESQRLRLAERSSESGTRAFVLRNAMLAVCAVVLVTSCRSAPVHDVMATPIPVSEKTLTVEQVSDLIVRAGLRADWDVVPQRPGQLTGRYAKRNHNAVVDIIHDTKTYTIKYRESTLGGGGGVVHPLYNTWVQNLDRSIRGEFYSVK